MPMTTEVVFANWSGLAQIPK